jgi:hypothetical protein
MLSPTATLANSVQRKKVAMNVLLIEDSPGDIRLTIEVFREADTSICLHVANDGMEGSNGFSAA